ncbi:MAG: DUF1844 domain-containing protein [Candidatus Binataceae bacterium]
MASEDDSSKGFKIQDRRRFSAEGELKPEFSGAEEAAAAKPDAAPASASHSAGVNTSAQPRDQAAASQPQQTAAAQGYAAARSAGGAEADPSEMGEISFGAFLMSLSTEALVHLGEVADPSSGQERRDLAMAQQLIDIMGMLREKTRGNLDHDEQALLDAILFDLRMKYVEIARRNG